MRVQHNGVDMNIILLYTIIAIASAMAIVVAFLTGNTMAAGWALVSTVSASGSIYLAKTVNNLKTPAQG